MDFLVFRHAVAKQFERMQASGNLFRANVNAFKLWDVYLTSFPEGSNPKFRERTEHDCACCRQFIRAVGDAVAIIDGKLESIWDVALPGEPEYAAVAKALSAFVHEHKVGDAFLHDSRTVGTEKNFEEIAGQAPLKWEHFHANLKAQYVQPETAIAKLLSEKRAAKEAFLNGLTRINDSALELVLELISDNALYRGAEKEFVVSEFRDQKRRFDALGSELERELFAWSESQNLHGSVSGIHTTSIGTLLTDLSEGMELEKAVKLFEFKVAGPNYQRTTAVASPTMIKKAQATIEELGLTSALERRSARIDDIKISDVIHASKQTRKVLTGNVFDEMAAATAAMKPVTQKLEKIEEIPIERFLSDVVPKASAIEVMVENRHTNNFVSLIAPVDPTAGNLFKWDNNFSWSYAGNFADAIKERVKAAGGSVEGDLCCRLAWEYKCDLDFHCYEPDGGHIFFGNRRKLSHNGGVLDLDANGADGQRDDPAENIVYADRRRMTEGVYRLVVHNYSRNSDGAGFEVEIEFDGQVHNFVYDRVVRQGENVEVAQIRYKNGKFEVVKSMPSTQTVREVWGVKTHTFTPVNAIMRSPNYWGDRGVGNLHYMFMLDGCVNEEEARPYYNEYLRDSLRPHRKVLEMLAGRTKVAPSPDQLSGLGFSSTMRNDAVFRVTGSYMRSFKVTF